MQTDPGMPFSPTDPPVACMHLPFLYPLSQVFSALCGARPSACYDNAFDCLSSLRLSSLRYVEGWMVWEHANLVKVIEHAWLEQFQLGILDPTMVWLVDEPEANTLRFFAALHYRASELANYRREELPTVRSHPGERTTTGLEHPGYQRAYQQAVFHARTLAECMTAPKQIVILPSYLRGEEVSFIRLHLSGSDLCIASVPDGMQEYIHAINTLFLYQCPSRQMAGRLCAGLRRRHHRAMLQLFRGNWVVVSQASEPELRLLLPLLARFGATPIRVQAQTHQLLLAGVKRPQREEPGSPPQQEHPSGLMGSRRRRRHKQHWFSPFLNKP